MADVDGRRWPIEQQVIAEREENLRRHEALLAAGHPIAVEQERQGRLRRWQTTYEPKGRGSAVPTTTEELQTWLGSLDQVHLNYASAYADELSVGDPPPSPAGLNPALVAEIRKRLNAEWRARWQRGANIRAAGGGVS